MSNCVFSTDKILIDRNNFVSKIVKKKKIKFDKGSMTKKIRFMLVRRSFLMGSSTTTNYAKKKKQNKKTIYRRYPNFRRSVV